MKKCSEETQTVHARCSKVEPKNFAPPQTPFLGAQNGPKFNQLWTPLPTNPVWWGSMHAFSSYSGNRPPHTHTHTPTNRQGWLQYTAPQLACNVIICCMV